MLIKVCDNYCPKMANEESSYDKKVNSGFPRSQMELLPLVVMHIRIAALYLCICGYFALYLGLRDVLETENCKL